MGEDTQCRFPLPATQETTTPRVFLLPLSHDLERVHPAVPEKTGNAPEHAERFYCTRPFRLAHVLGLPSELFNDPASTTRYDRVSLIIPREVAEDRTLNKCYNVA
jgi:hypothetical protein